MKKKNKNKSLVSQTIHMFVIQSALLGIVIVTYICVSYYTVLENMQTSSRNLLQLYGKELENKLENADMLLERLSMHVARHSFAVFALNKGLSMTVVSRLLGHGSTDVTEKVYARFLPETLSTEVARLKDEFKTLEII